MDNPGIWNAGFFPEHLTLTDPFFLNAFLKSSYIQSYFLKNKYEILVNVILHLISFIILVLIVVQFIKIKRSRKISFEKISFVFIPFFVIIGLTIIFLLYFTLHYHEIPRPGWTHIGDPRYLTPVYISVIAIVIFLIFLIADHIKSWEIKAVKSMLILLIFISLLINIYIVGENWGRYSYKSDNYKVPEDDLQELFYSIKTELSDGKVPVFVDNDLTVRSARISQYAGAAVIPFKQVIKINQFPSNMIFFFILPEQLSYTEKDRQLLEWGKKFNLKNIGKVYSSIPLFMVDNK